MLELPQGFVRRLRRLLGEEAEAFFAALEKSPSRAFRFDPKKTSFEELEALFSSGLEERIPFCEYALRFSVPSIGNHPLHLGGALYVQEPAAMAPVAALGKKPCRRILDLCAAPGGKSLQAAALLAPGGVMVHNEPHPARRKVLMQNLERAGVRRSLVTGLDASRLPSSWREAFDLVICDVPCSGEGMMRKSESACRMWSEENVFHCARRQSEILESAAAAVEPGGRLLYSTCTWAVEENEGQIAAFLQNHPEFSLIPPAGEVSACAVEGISLPESGQDLSLCLRFYPHRFSGEGQFLAVLQKEGIPGERKEPKKRERKKEKPDPRSALVREFLEETLVSLPEETVMFREESIYLVPSHPLEERDLVSPGVLVGTVQKGRVIPHHRFFLAYANDFRSKTVLTGEDPRVGAYLSGEEIPVEGEGGWSVVFYHRCPLGGIKISQGRGKNYYPKGLRKAVASDGEGYV